MITYSELLKNRRSIRNYQNREVSDEIIRGILEDTCLAPSASNTQPWEFIVIRDKSLMQRISDASKKNILTKIAANLDADNKRYKKMLEDKTFNVFYNAPCLVLIAGKNNYHHFIGDCAIAATYLMFAAVSRGLGTCWIGLGSHIENDPELLREIKFPVGYEIAAAIILGYPAEKPTASSRKPLKITNV